jgi:hypothetical protein
MDGWIRGGASAREINNVTMSKWLFSFKILYIYII